MSKKFSPQEAIETVRRFSTLISGARDRYKELYDKVGKCDRETSDIVHDIEFSTFNSKEGSIKARTLQKVRKQRRAAKDEMEYIACIKKIFDIEGYDDIPFYLDEMLNDLNKVKEQQASRMYCPKEKPVELNEEEDG